MLHYTLKISHCTGETQTQNPSQSLNSVSVLGVRSTGKNCGCPHQSPCAVVFLFEVAYGIKKNSEVRRCLSFGTSITLAECADAYGTLPMS